MILTSTLRRLDRVYELVISALLVTLFGCGASTELDEFASLVDIGVVDASAPSQSFRPAPDTLIAAFSGRTDRTGEQWSRPFDCSTGAIADGGHFFVRERFSNPTPLDLRITVLVDWSFDGFLHVFASFYPNRPSTQCIDSNDDFVSTTQSQVTGVLVPAGSNVDLVLSSSISGDSGSYDAFVIAE